MSQHVIPLLLELAPIAAISHSAVIAYRSRRRSLAASYCFSMAAMLLVCLYVGTTLGSNTMSHYLWLCCLGYGTFLIWAYRTNSQNNVQSRLDDHHQETCVPQSESLNNEAHIFWEHSAFELPEPFVDDWVGNPAYASTPGNLYYREPV